MLNTLLSFGQDRRWRRIAARLVSPKRGERFLDLAAGTGAFAAALKQEESGVRVVAADFCAPILSRTPASLAARVGADALRLPFRDGAFDGLVIAFGLRNFSDPAQGLAEMHRVLKPGGRGVILEFLRPDSGLFGALYRWYLRLWIPLLGGLLSGSFSAYRHLTDTIHGFMTRDQFRGLLAAGGFETVRARELSFGAATAFHILKKSITIQPQKGAKGAKIMKD